MDNPKGSGDRRPIKPYMPGTTGTDHGRKAENRMAKRMGAKLTPASGALDHAKGDMTKGNWRIESKATLADSYRVTFDDLLKISQEALDHLENPAFAIQFVNQDGKARHNGSWVMIPEHVYKELLT